MGFAKRQQILKIHNSNGPTPSPSTLTLTHSKYMNAQSCTSANTDALERARLARLEFRVVFYC